MTRRLPFMLSPSKHERERLGRSSFDKLRTNGDAAKLIALALSLISLFLGSSQAWGVERSPIPTVEIDDLPHEADASRTLLDYLRERTQLGIGYRETYNDNLFLQDNNKQDDWISESEAEILFADPKGALLYGIDYEINDFYYVNTRVNWINHDLRVFADLDQKTRLHYRLDSHLRTAHGLVFGASQEGVDIVRRSAAAGVQASMEYIEIGRITYALNNTNSLVPAIQYKIYDDRSANDTDTDRRDLLATLDMDHDLRPGWLVFTGLSFNDVTIPKNRSKDSHESGGRLGTRYTLTEISELEATLTLGRREFKNGFSPTSITFDGKWKYKPGPRTTLNLGFFDGNVPSFSSDRLQFHSTRPSGELIYELSPRTKLNLGANYERQQAKGGQVLSGSQLKASRYGLTAGIEWQVREQMKVTLDYKFNRSRTSDYTNQIWALGFEAEL
ncbi:MAG: hypothetical protein HY211_04340 [Candidatus Omnitrophica bacterium]|nr:hypothetical protein [Candidatus Omnitrophota bacterium]